MTLANLYRSLRRPAAIGLAIISLVGGVMAGTTLSGSTDKTVPLFMIGAMVLFGVGGAVIIVARPASSPRRDTILFFLAGAASAAVAGGAADSPLATFIAVLNALLALIMCVLSTLLTAEQSLDNPRSRF